MMALINSLLFAPIASWEKVRSCHSLSPSISFEPLALIHCDLLGPSPEYSIIGFSYYISFVDNCTKYVWLYPLTAKSQAFETFLKFKVYVENMVSCKIKAFQTDRGGEFTTRRFSNF